MRVKRITPEELYREGYDGGKLPSGKNPVYVELVDWTLVVCGDSIGLGAIYVNVIGTAPENLDDIYYKVFAADQEAEAMALADTVYKNKSPYRLGMIG